MKLIKGKVYTIRHNRKGTFRGKYLGGFDDWATFEIVDGEASYVNQENRGTGEEITVRRSFCHFSKVKEK